MAERWSSADCGPKGTLGDVRHLLGCPLASRGQKLGTASFTPRPPRTEGHWLPQNTPKAEELACTQKVKAGTGRWGFQ